MVRIGVDGLETSIKMSN